MFTVCRLSLGGPGLMRGRHCGTPGGRIAVRLVDVPPGSGAAGAGRSSVVNRVSRPDDCPYYGNPSSALRQTVFSVLAGSRKATATPALSGKAASAGAAEPVSASARPKRALRPAAECLIRKEKGVL